MSLAVSKERTLRVCEGPASIRFGLRQNGSPMPKKQEITRRIRAMTDERFGRTREAACYVIYTLISLARRNAEATEAIAELLQIIR